MNEFQKPMVSSPSVQSSITFFLVPSGSDTADPKKAFESVTKMPEEMKIEVKLVPLNSLSEVNAAPKRTFWYGVIYDNEVLDEGLKEYLDVFLNSPDFDYYGVYKRTAGGKLSESPRLFRSSVKLKEGSLVPEQWEALRFEHILNGWIKSDD